MALCAWMERRLKSTDVSCRLEICGDKAEEDRVVFRLLLEENHETLWHWNMLARNASGGTCLHFRIQNCF